MQDVYDAMAELVDKWTPDGEKEVAREGVKLVIAALCSGAPAWEVEDAARLAREGSLDAITAKREELMLMWGECDG